MSIQTRTTALQNEIARLYCHFNKDGILSNPIGQPMVEILDRDGVTVICALNAVMEQPGIFYVDWFVPANLPLGNYYDRWTYQWDNSSGASEMTMIITVRSLESYINFLSKGIDCKTSAAAAQLLNDLENDFIYEAQHIPVYFEQGHRIQQENRPKAMENYYYFTLDTYNYYNASEGDIFVVNSKRFTVFQTITSTIESSSSEESSISSNSGSSTSTEYQSSSSTSSDSSLSTEYQSSSSSSSSSTLNASTSSEEFTTTTTTPYQEQTILTCVGISDPPDSGTLVFFKGNSESSKAIKFISVAKKVSRMSTVFGFAYGNWRQDPSPIVRLGKRIIDDGWHADYDGKLYFDRLLSPEDVPNVSYSFSYFSKQELLSFLQLGLNMMNGLPPASETYSTLSSCPRAWWGPIILYAAATAMRRLIFGWSFQERRIIYGRPEEADKAYAIWQDLYKTYNDLFAEQAKNTKTRKLPGMVAFISPEYSLPGGRSRWFRYLYKG
jgi:hypothetical protein